LQGVGRVLGIPHDPEGDGPETILVSHHQSGERVGISSNVCAQQLGVWNGFAVSLTFKQAITPTSSMPPRQLLK
jgi:hypothetical protein